MIVYLYRWRLNPDKIEQFTKEWIFITQQLLKAGSLGSRLHHGSDGIYYGYAQWPSDTMRDKATFCVPDMIEVQKKMSDAIVERFPEVILDPVKDLLDLSILNDCSTRAPALNQVTVSCNDLAQSISFYEKLNLLLIVKNAHYARLECANGTTLSLELTDNHQQSCSAAIYFEHQNLDQWIAKLKAQGLVFEQAAEDKSWLWREAWLKDPFGNRICLYHAGVNRRFPPWRLGI